MGKTTVEIMSGPHLGRRGLIVSIPWIGNLWHTWVTVNVLATKTEAAAEYGAAYGSKMDEICNEIDHGFGPRTWITVLKSQTRILSVAEMAEDDERCRVGITKYWSCGETVDAEVLRTSSPCESEGSIPSRTTSDVL